MEQKKMVVITNKNSGIEDIFIKNYAEEYNLVIYRSIEECINFDIDLIIIDTNIGYEKSIRIFELLNEDIERRNIVKIAIIDKSSIKELENYIQLGVNDYILSPFSSEELDIRISNQISLINTKTSLKVREIQLETLLDNTPYMVWFKDKDCNYIKVNSEFKEHCGKSDYDIRGKSDDYVWNGGILEVCKEYEKSVMIERKQKVFEEIIPGKKGYRQFNVCKSPIIDEFDDVIGTMGIARDITEFKNKDIKLQMLMDNLPFLVWLCDARSVYINANKNFTDYFNVTIHELVGKTPVDFYSEKDAENIFAENQEVIESRKSMKFESVVNTNEGIRNVEIYKTPIFGIDNEVLGIACAMIDVTDFKQAQKKIKKQALTDSLTQIPNRRSLYDYMQNEMDFSKVGIMLIDIDNFKDINDYYGHHFGDEVIKITANKLKEICNGAFVCRLGGDEFLVIYKNLQHEEILHKKAMEILHEVSKKEDNTYNFSVSVGVAMGQENDDIDRLLVKVDIAMYKSKELGKNKFMAYTQDLEDERSLNINIEKDLRLAIEKKEINLIYQPQYTSDKRLVGFEALFRWNNEEYKNISIIKIISIMESSGLIVEIGEQIFRKACIFAKKINEKSLNKIVVSVNISAIQIMEKDFIKKISNIINETKVDTGCIGIEITETALLNNIDENIKKIIELRNMGIHISLDDFGTGYSSLNYIVQIPLDWLKVDKSFIKGMSINKNYSKLLEVIITASHSLNFKIVAEGVETKEQLTILKNMNIDFIQGYLFSKPVPEEEAMKLLSNNKGE